MRASVSIERLAGRPALFNRKRLRRRHVAHHGAVDELHHVERGTVHIVVVHSPAAGATGTLVGCSAERILCSRDMSWAVARTCPSGGRRNTQRWPVGVGHAEGEVRVATGDERERQRRLGGRYVPTNQAVTFSLSMPSTC